MRRICCIMAIDSAAVLRIKNGEKWRETEYGTNNSAGGR